MKDVKNGYHVTTFDRGTFGEISKVIEEAHEYIDAKEQRCKIMAQLELSDLYGALEAVAKKEGLTMDDLKIMSDITQRAFRNGHR